MSEQDYNDAPRQRESYLEAVVSMQRHLLTTTSNERGSLNHALEPLAKAAGASRVYLFVNHHGAEGELLTSQRAEWCAPGINSELDNPQLQNLPYSEFIQRWADEMMQQRCINGLVDDFPECERAILEPQGVLALLVIPFQVNGEFKGFIGFDQCTEPRHWSEQEVNLLRVAATNIGLILDQRHAQQRQHELNVQLAAARDQALLASQAKSAFLAKVSHELRTPLNAVIGYSELLLDEPDDVAIEQWTDDVRRILSSGRHLLSVINDLLDLSRAEAGKLELYPEPLNLDHFLDDLEDSVARLGRRNNNQFKQLKPERLGTFILDEIRLRQILLNLLSNAFKYTQDGEVTLRVWTSERSLFMAVEDNGIGMEADQLELIFEAFIQADNSATRAFEGTGLGLAITKHLCELMSATIEVSSTPEHGSCFTVQLPLAHIKESHE